MHVVACQILSDLFDFWYCTLPYVLLVDEMDAAPKRLLLSLNPRASEIPCVCFPQNACLWIWEAKFISTNKRFGNKKVQITSNNQRIQDCWSCLIRLQVCMLDSNTSYLISALCFWFSNQVFSLESFQCRTYPTYLRETINLQTVNGWLHWTYATQKFSSIACVTSKTYLVKFKI